MNHVIIKIIIGRINKKSKKFVCLPATSHSPKDKIKKNIAIRVFKNNMHA